MKLHLPKALLAAIVAVGAALPAMQAEEADTSTTTVLSSTDLSYNPTIYTLGDPLNNTLAAVYQTTLVPAVGSEPAKWNVDTTASNKTWGELYGDGYGAANTDNYNTLRVVSPKEYGFNFATLSLAGVIVESSADGASFKGLNSGTRNIKIGKTGEESASYFGGSFTFDSYSASNNESSISLAGTQTWYIKGDETVTLKAKNGISNGGSLTISGGGKLALSSNFTNTGTLALVGSELTINNTLTGTVTADSASTINVANIDLLNKRLANKDSWSNGMEANGEVELNFDYIVAESGINGKASYTYNGEQKQTTLTDGSYIRENESAYGVVTGSKLSEIVGAVKNNGGNYIIIKDGITLTRDTTNAGFTTPQKLTGAGIYDLGKVSENAPSAVLGNNMTLDKTWTGTVSLSGGESRNCTNGESKVNEFCVQSINFNALGRSGSTVEIAEGGLYGYLSVGGGTTGTYDPNIKLTGDLTIQNGNGNANIIFAGKISGGGNMVLARYGGGANSYTFQNDISGWLGNLISKDNSSQNGIIHNVILTGGATTVKAGIDLQGEELNLTVNNTGKTTTFANNVKVTTFLAQAGDVVLAKDKSLTAGTIKVGAEAETPTLKVTGADGSNAAKLTGATEVGGKIQQTTSGITVSNMTLANVKLTGANVNTAITLQDVAGAATLATGTYTVAAVAGAATAAAENVALSFTLGGLTGLTLDNADTKLVINTVDVLAAVGDAESFTLSFNFGKGISLYDGEWTAEALSGAITFGGALGEWLSGSETEYTLASDAVATASLDGLVPTVTYAMTNGVLTSITVSGNIPEPTTATLSLLALAALAARRRRK